MSHRKILVGAIAMTVGLAALPTSADAAWRGIRWFSCEGTDGNWNFDGLYGPHTERAVRNFQEMRGLHVDGIAGPETQRALGLRYRRTFRCGMGGNDVFALQQALAAEGYWYGGKGTPRAAAPAPTPSLRPMPRASATPGWVEPPVMVTPAPGTPEPVEMPTPEPTEAPISAQPTPPPYAPTPMPAPANEPTLEVGAGAWLLPTNAGSLSYDWGFTAPAYTANASLWWGNWGLGGAMTLFNTTYVDFRAQPYFQPNTYMYDALLKYRFDSGYEQVFAGYRGLGLGDVNWGTLGLGLNRPLAGDWLWLNAKAQGGYSMQNAWFLDGEAGLGLRFNPVALNLGFRHLSMQVGTDPQFNINGPTANVEIRF